MTDYNVTLTCRDRSDGNTFLVSLEKPNRNKAVRQAVAQANERFGETAWTVKSIVQLTGLNNEVAFLERPKAPPTTLVEVFPSSISESWEEVTDGGRARGLKGIDIDVQLWAAYQAAQATVDAMEVIFDAAQEAWRLGRDREHLG